VSHKIITRPTIEPINPAQIKPMNGLPVVTEIANAVRAVINNVPSIDKLITPDFSLIVSPNTTKTIGALNEITVINEVSNGNLSVL
tara:strand:- start:178 stop:435 length:258 start_codon:yes stop_codon:yes gene_type:complete